MALPLRKDPKAPMEAPITGPVFPPLDQPFRLTLDGAMYYPMLMLGRDGMSDFEWKFLGCEVQTVQSHWFRLRRSGPCKDLDEVKRRIGPLAGGQWREAFRRTFVPPAETCYIGFAGDLWRSPEAFLEGQRDFYPYLIGTGLDWSGNDPAFRGRGSDFRWVGAPVSDLWLWLTPVA